MASNPRSDRPKAFAVGQTPQAMSKQNSGGFDQAKAASPKAMPPKFNGSSQSNKNKGAFPPPGEHAGNVRYCFHCGKSGHMMKSCVLWQQKESVKPANVKRVEVLNENSIISHAIEPLVNHGAVCGTITEVTGMTVCDDVGVFDVRHDEVISGHLIDTGFTTLNDGPVFINESASTEVIDSSSANSGSGAASDATSSCVSRVAGGSAVVDDDVISEAQRNDQLIDTCLSTTMSVNELSPLKYVSVRIENDSTKENKVLFALCDTGAVMGTSWKKVVKLNYFFNLIFLVKLSVKLFLKISSTKLK